VRGGTTRGAAVVVGVASFAIGAHLPLGRRPSGSRSAG
jgi:hypothetical protein